MDVSKHGQIRWIQSCCVEEAAGWIIYLLTINQTNPHQTCPIWSSLPNLYRVSYSSELLIWAKLMCDSSEILLSAARWSRPVPTQLEKQKAVWYGGCFFDLGFTFFRALEITCRLSRVWVLSSGCLVRPVCVGRGLWPECVFHHSASWWLKICTWGELKWALSVEGRCILE